MGRVTTTFNKVFFTINALIALVFISFGSWGCIFNGSLAVYFLLSWAEQVFKVPQ